MIPFILLLCFFFCFCFFSIHVNSFCISISCRSIKQREHSMATNIMRVRLHVETKRLREHCHLPQPHCHLRLNSAEKREAAHTVLLCLRFLSSRASRCPVLPARFLLLSTPCYTPLCSLFSFSRLHCRLYFFFPSCVPRALPYSPTDFEKLSSPRSSGAYWLTYVEEHCFIVVYLQMLASVPWTA